MARSKWIITAVCEKLRRKNSQSNHTCSQTFSLDLRWTVQAAKKEMSKLIEKDDFHLLLPGGKALEDEEKKFKV
eukprot:760476-Hanusia_phi.AAC.3